MRLVALNKNNIIVIPPKFIAEAPDQLQSTGPATDNNNLGFHRLAASH
jgi:hypothetical protein